MTFVSFRWSAVPVVLLLALGLAVRLSDLTDPPLDFHPTRQLRGMLLARERYWRWNSQVATPEQRAELEHAVARMGRYEPPVLETLVAATYYGLGREVWWVARVYSSLFWLLAAWATYHLARATAPHPAGAWVTVGVLAVHPFAVRATRAFQPDPLMAAALVGGAWALWRWMQRPTARRGAAAVALLALAGWIKVFALPAAVLMLLYAGWAVYGRQAWRVPRVWLGLLLVLLPALAFYAGSRAETVGAYWHAWVWDLRGLWLSKRLYARWTELLVEIYGGGWLLAAALGVLLLPPRARGLALAWAVGYGIYGLTVPYQMMTHSYYHLALMPLWAWTVAPVAARAIQALPARKGAWAAALLVGGFAALYAAGDVYDHLRDNDYHEQAERWARAAALMPAGRCVGLVEYYGYGLAYFGQRDVDPWPTAADQALARLRGREAAADQAVQQHLAGYDCFVVTDLRAWERRPALRAALRAYPLLVQRDEVLIFDVRSSRHPAGP